MFSPIWDAPDSVRFPNGQLLLDWVAEVKTEVKPDEVTQ